MTMYTPAVMSLNQISEADVNTEMQAGMFKRQRVGL